MKNKEKIKVRPGAANKKESIEIGQPASLNLILKALANDPQFSDLVAILKSLYEATAEEKSLAQLVSKKEKKVKKLKVDLEKKYPGAAEFKDKLEEEAGGEPLSLEEQTLTVDVGEELERLMKKEREKRVTRFRERQRKRKIFRLLETTITDIDRADSFFRELCDEKFNVAETEFHEKEKGSGEEGVVQPGTLQDRRRLEEAWSKLSSLKQAKLKHMINFLKKHFADDLIEKHLKYYIEEDKERARVQQRAFRKAKRSLYVEGSEKPKTRMEDKNLKKLEEEYLRFWKSIATLSKANPLRKLLEKRKTEKLEKFQEEIKERKTSSVDFKNLKKEISMFIQALALETLTRTEKGRFNLLRKKEVKNLVDKENLVVFKEALREKMIKKETKRLRDKISKKASALWAFTKKLWAKTREGGDFEIETFIREIEDNLAALLWLHHQYQKAGGKIREEVEDVFSLKQSEELEEFEQQIPPFRWKLKEVFKEARIKAATRARPKQSKKQQTKKAQLRKNRLPAKANKSKGKRKNRKNTIFKKQEKEKKQKGLN
jgi:hypothetical protein